LPNTSKKDDKMNLTSKDKKRVFVDDLEELMLLSLCYTITKTSRFPANRRVLKIIFCGDSAIYKLSEPL
jgi:hypothetical protein